MTLNVRATRYATALHPRSSSCVPRMVTPRSKIPKCPSAWRIRSAAPRWDALKTRSSSRDRRRNKRLKSGREAMARTESAAEVCLPKGALLIGESRLETASGGKCAHVNPATGRAQARWRTLTPSGRRDLLLRLASLLEQNSDELSTIVALETGTPKIASGAAP